jgi:uncharacterized protein (DUF362 family)
MKTTAQVSLSRCPDYESVKVRDGVHRLLQPFGGIEALVGPGERILLKPNFVSKPTPGVPACTHAEVILAVARMVREAGATPIFADSPAFGTTKGIAKAIGLEPKASEEGFEVTSFPRSVVRTVELGGATYRLSVAAETLECDGILNLAKFKSHRQATFTFGVKNLYGCVVGKRKPFRHFASSGDLDWFSNMLIANAKLISPRFTLVDGIVAMEGQGPTKGTPRPLHLLVGGIDTIAVDTTCCQVVGQNPYQLCTLKAARRLGYGTWDPDRIELVGDPLESFVVADFRFAETMPIFFSLPRLAKSYLKSVREATLKNGDSHEWR